MEDGETPQDTAARECLGEPAWPSTPTSSSVKRVHPVTERHMIYVACRPVSGTQVVVGDPKELAEVSRRRLDELDELMPYTVFEPVVRVPTPRNMRQGCGRLGRRRPWRLW
jgi:8-oxo-dGTP diphosphatase